MIAVIGPASRNGPHQVAEAAASTIAAMERAVADSGLDWTIARLKLTSNPATGQARISPGLFARPTVITRADAARALLDITEDQALARTAANVAGPARKGNR